MQRVIKFRIWFHEWERMLYKGEGENYEPVIHLDGSLSGVSTVQKYDLMQFIGLHDKNGKEIYEGDILNGRNSVLKIVYWCDKRAAFCESEQFKPTPAKISFARLYDKYVKNFNEKGVLKNHWVVGNIHENPELINSASIAV